MTAADGRKIYLRTQAWIDGEPATVTNGDGDKDVLTGSSGADSYFADFDPTHSLLDKVTDLGADESPMTEWVENAF